jgi:hypothetical protein
MQHFELPTLGIELHDITLPTPHSPFLFFSITALPTPHSHTSPYDSHTLLGFQYSTSIMSTCRSQPVLRHPSLTPDGHWKSLKWWLLLSGSSMAGGKWKC